jgi:hypothetical protein
VRIDGLESFALRPGDRVAVIVDGQRLGGAVCDSSRQLIPDKGAAREWLNHTDLANVAGIAVVTGPTAAREYELREVEVGAVVITTRRSPDRS